MRRGDRLQVTGDRKQAPLRLDKIREALRDTITYPVVVRRLRALTDAELAEALDVEKLSKRRNNMLRPLHFERNRRAGNRNRQQLKVEANL